MIREYFVGLPKACGVPDGLAEIYGKLNGELYDFERDNPGSVFERVDGQNEWERLEPGFAPWVKYADPAIVTYAHSLGEYLSRVTAYNKNGIGDATEIDSFGKGLEAIEPAYPTVSALMTVGAASIQSSWA